MRWVFGLAERLHMTVGRMLADMSSTELTYWLAYDRAKHKPVVRPTAEQLAGKLRAILGGAKQ